MGKSRGEGMSNLTIYCDFDGTITTTDNIISIMKHFAPPAWEQVKDDILSQNISIKEGVGKMFSLLPSSSKIELIDYLFNTTKIRPGFRDFVHYTRQKNIDLKITSGGIDFFVFPLLEDLVDRQNIYCNSADFSNEFIQILWPYPCDEHCQNDCGCCKTSIIRKLEQPNDFNIVIGDSITDLEPAKLANLVFACDDFLVDKCKEFNLPYKKFDTFYDVITTLEEIQRKVVNE